MYAIIEQGGKQYKVSQGDTIYVEKTGLNPGDTLEITQVLAIAKEDGVVFGAPTVKGAAVTAKVVEDFKAKKVIVYKYKSKKGFHKKNGHRQQYTRIKIESIQG